jgi:hypothetical protein
MFASNWPIAVFVTLRPETFHRSLRGGALSVVPSTRIHNFAATNDVVIEKRLAFALQIAFGFGAIASHRGMKARFPNLMSLIRVSRRHFENKMTCMSSSTISPVGTSGSLSIW